jgi:hypothetical protein
MTDINTTPFKAELIDILNRYHVPEGTGTPASVLAEFVYTTLRAFNVAVAARERQGPEPIRLVEPVYEMEDTPIHGEGELRAIIRSVLDQGKAEMSSTRQTVLLSDASRVSVWETDGNKWLARPYEFRMTLDMSMGCATMARFIQAEWIKFIQSIQQDYFSGAVSEAQLRATITEGRKIEWYISANAPAVEAVVHAFPSKVTMAVYIENMSVFLASEDRKVVLK